MFWFRSQEAQTRSSTKLQDYSLRGVGEGGSSVGELIFSPDSEGPWMCHGEEEDLPAHMTSTTTMMMSSPALSWAA